MSQETKALLKGLGLLGLIVGLIYYEAHRKKEK
jgi:hypothetical protein